MAPNLTKQEEKKKNTMQVIQQQTKKLSVEFFFIYLKQSREYKKIDNKSFKRVSSK
jgi:hypothetical protein